MKNGSWLWLLFIIILIDNIVASMALIVSMHLFFAAYATENEYMINKIVFVSGFIFILSPAYIIASPLLGWLSDIIGRKKPLLICLVTSLGGYFLLLMAAISNNLLLALCSILFCNAGSSSMTIVQSATADISCGRKRAYMLGFIVAVMLPIFLLVMQLTEGVSNLFPHARHVDSVIAILAILFTFVNVLIVLLKLPNNSNDLSLNTNRKEDIFLVIGRLIRNKLFLKLIGLLALVQFSCGLYMAVVTNYLNLVLNNATISANNYLVYGLMLFSIVILYPLLLRFFSIPKILLWSIVGCFVGVIGCQLALYAPGQWVFLACLAMGECIMVAATWWLLLEWVEPQDWGISMGVKGSIWALSWALSVVVANSFIDEKIPHISFYISLGVLFSSIILAYNILKKIQGLNVNTTRANIFS